MLKALSLALKPPVPKPLVLALTLLVAAPLRAGEQTPVQDSNALLQDLQRYEASLANLETTFGPFDPRLQEPLSSMQRLFTELGDFERVREIQSRRLQLLRTSRGLQHPDIIPLVEAIISTEMQLGNWVQISDQLNHLRNLAQANFGPQSPELLAAIDRQASWYLARVYLDTNRQRADNYMDSRDLYADLLKLAEQAYGEDDPRLIPWLYKRTYSLYQLVALLNSAGSLRGSIIDETVRRDGVMRLQSVRSRGFSSFAVSPFQRIPVTEVGEPVGVAYLRLASGYIDDIAAIAEASGDWETWAMAKLYRGDYALLAGHSTGRGHHREALEKLQELGHSRQRLEAVFNRPMPIPEQVFFTRFEELAARQLAAVGNLQPQLPEDHGFDPDKPWEAPVHVGIFTGWEQSIGEVAKPLPADPLLRLDLPCQQTDLQFRVTSRGTVASVNVLPVAPDQARARRTAQRAVRNMRFRPAWYDGRTRTRPVVQLRYRLLTEQDEAATDFCCAACTG